jgi:hypothetical protein
MWKQLPQIEDAVLAPQTEVPALPPAPIWRLPVEMLLVEFFLVTGG